MRALSVPQAYLCMGNTGDSLTGAWSQTTAPIPLQAPAQWWGVHRAAAGGCLSCLCRAAYPPLQHPFCWHADSLTGLFYATGDMVTARSLFSMVQLADGTILAAGGFNGPAGAATGASEVFDVSRGTWRATGALNMPRGNFVMSALPDGTVIAAGGSTSNNNAIASTEIFNPATGLWALSHSFPQPIEGAQAVLL